MNSEVTPEAFFDSLSLGNKLDSFLDGFNLQEIHLFSYFSSFLYCYSGKSIATWPHKYVAYDGYPFSETIHKAIDRHIQNGLFESEGDYFRMTRRGNEEYENFKDQTLFLDREKIINAACTTSILVPYSQTLRALQNEPDLKRALEINSRDWLDQSSFYPQFEKIVDALGVQTSDLVIPAVAWINLLTENIVHE